MPAISLRACYAMPVADVTWSAVTCSRWGSANGFWDVWDAVNTTWSARDSGLFKLKAGHAGGSVLASEIDPRKPQVLEGFAVMGERARAKRPSRGPQPRVG
eukprot:2284410-Rhodomonas_salina.1